MQTALTFAPLASTSWTFNSVLGSTASGTNTAANNFYYDENKSVGQAAVVGGFFAIPATAAANWIPSSLRGMPSSVDVPYFQTPATIAIPLPAATTVGKSAETVIQNIPALLRMPETQRHPTENGNG